MGGESAETESKTKEDPAGPVGGGRELESAPRGGR